MTQNTIFYVFRNIWMKTTSSYSRRKFDHGTPCCSGEQNTRAHHFTSIPTTGQGLMPCLVAERDGR